MRKFCKKLLNNLNQYVMVIEADQAEVLSGNWKVTEPIIHMSESAVMNLYSSPKSITQGV